MDYSSLDEIRTTFVYDLTRKIYFVMVKFIFSSDMRVRLLPYYVQAEVSELIKAAVWSLLCLPYHKAGAGTIRWKLRTIPLRPVIRAGLGVGGSLRNSIQVPIDLTTTIIPLFSVPGTVCRGKSNDS